MQWEIMSKTKWHFRQHKAVVLSILSFILGCILTTSLTPIDRTCKLENEDREYNIMKNSKLKHPEVIILILSAPKNLDKRNTIRETWLRLKNTKSAVQTKHYFILGSLGLTVDAMLHLTSEQSQFNDMLIVPVYDSYRNLTQKVMQSFVWLSERIDLGFEFKYVLKCDDDSFVRVDSLVHEISQMEIIYLKSDVRHLLESSSPYVTINVQANEEHHKSNNLMLYWGYFHGNARVRRSGKYKETSWILCDTYLPYALGGGYVLSKGLVTFIAKNSEHFRYYNSEDVSVGAWIASAKNVIRIHDRRFNTEWISRGCENHYLVSHNLSNQDIRRLYNNVASSGKLCDVEARKKQDYLYNWSAPSSKCCVKT